MTSTEKLVEALKQANAPTHIQKRAAADAYNDFKSDSATPIMDLVRDLNFAGLTELARRAREGEFDATKEESDSWAQRFRRK